MDALPRTGVPEPDTVCSRSRTARFLPPTRGHTTPVERTVASAAKETKAGSTLSRISPVSQTNALCVCTTEAMCEDTPKQYRTTCSADAKLCHLRQRHIVHGFVRASLTARAQRVPSGQPPRDVHERSQIKGICTPDHMSTQLLPV